MTIQDGAPGSMWGLATVLLFKIKYAFLSAPLQVDLLNTMITAAFGATVGFFVHLFWKWISRKVKK